LLAPLGRESAHDQLPAAANLEQALPAQHLERLADGRLRHPEAQSDLALGDDAADRQLPAQDRHPDVVVRLLGQIPGSGARSLHWRERYQSGEKIFRAAYGRIRARSASTDSNQRSSAALIRLTRSGWTAARSCCSNGSAA